MRGVWCLLAIAIFGVAAVPPRPVVLWHGMGDTCCLPFSMGAVKKEIEKSLPGVYVHSIMIGSNEAADEMHGFLSNVNKDVAHVCEMLRSDDKLQGGFNAIGFSQGGQFLRAYTERCNDPPVHNLITFGGQHQGVSDIPKCVSMNKTLCSIMADMLGKGAYLPIIRENLVQAQYFKDPMDNEGYLAHNQFLPDINNALPSKNATYKENLLKLNAFVMIKFEKDSVVVPRDSEYFGQLKLGSHSEIIPVWESDLYKEDWIGLRQLNETGRLHFKSCPGDHMQFTMDYLHDEVIVPYLS